MTKKQTKSVDKFYKLTRDAAPLSYMLPTRNSRKFPLMYFDEDTNTNRVLRYSSNQKTIFEDGMLSVTRTNPVLQEFLHYHPLNGVKFVEIDNEKDASMDVEILNLEIDALIAAKELDINMLENISRVLFGRDTSKMSTAEVRRDILVFAKREPEYFLDTLTDPTLQLQGNVQMFFDKGLVSFRKNNTEVWYSTSSNKTRMLTVPYGNDAKETVASYLSSDDGLESLKMLENLLQE